MAGQSRHGLLHDDCYVMLHIGTGPSRLETQGDPSSILLGAGKRFMLTENIWVERLDEELAKNVQKACEPANHNISAVQQDRHLYAYVRRITQTEKWNYEAMEAILQIAALSRLIHPTSIGYRYCAKIFNFGTNDPLVQAIQYRGVSPDVFLGDGRRDWLSMQDGEELLRLAPWFSTKPLADRIHRAYWNHEYALHSYYLDARWVLVVSGLEALTNVDERNIGLQFRSRVRKLAMEMKVDLSEDELTNAWRLRSKLAHAKSFLVGLGAVLPHSEHKPLYDKLEELLRTAVKRCLLDEEFASRFQDDAAVLKNWPIR